MSASVLKLIAIVTMVIDHIGFIFFPQYQILRYIGRVSLPLFMFLLAEGFFYTKNVWKYALRLAIFAVASEIPHDLFTKGVILEFQSQNIMLELLLALLALICVRKMTEGKYLFALGIPAAFVLSQVLNFSYGFYGILMAVLFYMFRQNRILLPVSLFASNLAYDLYNSRQAFSVQWPAIFAAIPIILYNGKKGFRMPKYLAYIFYPVHMLLFYLIRLWL